MTGQLEQLEKYATALKKWKRMKDVRDANEKLENPARLKPLESMPQPKTFLLDENDQWTIKTREQIIGRPIVLPIRRMK